MPGLRKDDRGVILIALIWILVALSVIALSFARESAVEVSAGRNTRDLSDAYYIARAGMMDAIYRIIQKNAVPQVRRLELSAPPDPIDSGKLTGTFGDGFYDIDIQDESGKMNLNLASDVQLRNLVEFIGIPKPDSDIIIDSILDWRDTDPNHRASGAENDYYETLDPPYKAKNGRFDTVEELLMIRGVTPDYFYGQMEKLPDGSAQMKYGLSRCFTTYTNTPGINVNYAPVPVLMSVPGMTPALAQLIVETRRSRPFQNPGDFSQLVRSAIEGNVMRFFSTQPAGVYTLTASARRDGSKVVRRFRAVVQTNVPNEPLRHRIIYWNENVPDLGQ